MTVQQNMKKKLNSSMVHYFTGKCSDLASATIPNNIKKFCNRKHSMVLKEDNPPYVPQARYIEEFCALLSRKVYHNGKNQLT